MSNLRRNEHQYGRQASTSRDTTCTCLSRSAVYYSCFPLPRLLEDLSPDDVQYHINTSSLLSGSPSLIILMVSVDFKYHVYSLTRNLFSLTKQQQQQQNSIIQNQISILHLIFTNLKQNEAQSARADSTHQGVKLALEIRNTSTTTKT